MAWRPGVNIIYTATAIDETSTEVQISYEAAYEFHRCFVYFHRHHSRKNSDGKMKGVYNCQICFFFFKEGLEPIMETDKKLEHLHSIKKNDKVTTVPEHYGAGADDDKKASLFQRQGQPDKNGKVLLIPTPVSAELLSPEFLDYWREISYLPCEFWQRWFHTHKFSIVLSSRREDIPHDLFLLSTTLGNQFPRITADEAAHEINRRLKKWSTFPLEDGRIYIYIFERTNFCMIRLKKIGLSYLVRVAFLVGVSMDDRLKYFEDIKRHVLDGQSGLKIIKKPIEKIMVRYKQQINVLTSPLTWSKLGLPTQTEQQTRWQVQSYLHHRRIIWEIESYGLSSLNELMMEIFHERLNEGYQVLNSSTGGIITLIYELQFHPEAGRNSQFTDARENMCILQLVMFPPVPVTHHSHHTNQQPGQLGMYHVTMEIWIEPKLGTCKLGPEIAIGKDFLKIANDQFMRDHQLIIMETTFNRLKDRLRHEVENEKKGVSMEDDRDQDLDPPFEDELINDVKFVKADAFENAFTDRMDRIIKVDSTFDLVQLLNNCKRQVLGYSLLANPEHPTEPNKGSDEVIDQLHAELKRMNEFCYDPEHAQFLVKNETLTNFVKHQYGKSDRRTESESTVVVQSDDDFDYDSDEDQEEATLTHRHHHRHSEGVNQCDDLCGASTTCSTMSWRVYLKYNEDNDEIVVTFVPLKLDDVEMLEKQLPEVFMDLAGEMETMTEIGRQRNESICSSTDAEKIPHTHMLPIFVCTAVHAQIKVPRDEIGFEALDRRWASPSTEPFLDRCCNAESDSDCELIDHKITTFMDPIYHHAFIRGIFTCLPSEKKLKVSQDDFRMALSRCVPVERNIDLTEAMLSWCDVWRHHYDEYQKTRDFVGSAFDENIYEPATPDPQQQHQYHQRSSSGEPGEVPSPSGNANEENVRDLEIDVNMDKAGSERENDTEAKIRKLVAQSIQHYFQEFPSECPYATYFFRDPDILFTDKSMESEVDFDGRSSINQNYRQNSYQDQSDRSTEKTEGCDTSGDFNGDQAFKAITDYVEPDDSELALSTASRLLHDVKIKDDDKAMSVRTEMTSDTLPDDDQTLDLCIEVKTPLFLQMEMQIWAKTTSGTKIDGHVVPLKNNLFTSVPKLIQAINDDASFGEKIDKIILDKDFRVNLKFNFWIVDEDHEIIALDEPCNEDCEQSILPQMPGDYTTAVVKTVKDIEMLLQDEVVAARRLQAVINSDILNFVTEHIKENNPQNSTSYDFYGNYSLASRLKRKEYDAEYKETPGSVPVRPILQCTLNQLPLRFVNSKDNYEDATNKFRSLLSMQNKFGTTENGFSQPADLFDHKDQKYKLDNYQFDLKNDDQYFYVILREVRAASEEGSPRDEDDSVGSLTDQSEPDFDSSTGSSRRTGILNTEPQQIIAAAVIGAEIDTIQLSQDHKFQPIEPDDSGLVDGFDREVERIMDQPIPSSTSTTSVATSKAASTRTTRGSVVSNKSLDMRRESTFRFEEEDSVKPDFWLILEIDAKPIEHLNFDDDYTKKNRICKPRDGEQDQLSKYPVINIYHHRRTADEPVYMHVGGDPIQIINRVKQSGDRGHDLPETVERKRNLTDADKDFIAEIEQYLQNLVHHVNQAFLLNDLFINHKCMSILMNRHKVKPDLQRKPIKSHHISDGALDRYQKQTNGDQYDNLHFGIFYFREGEFEPSETQVGFGNELVWSTPFPVHYRIRECVKRGLGRPLKAFRVHNRTDMYIYHNRNFDYGLG